MRPRRPKRHRTSRCRPTECRRQRISAARPLSRSCPQLRLQPLRQLPRQLARPQRDRPRFQLLQRRLSHRRSGRGKLSRSWSSSWFPSRRARFRPLAALRVPHQARLRHCPRALRFGRTVGVQRRRVPRRKSVRDRVSQRRLLLGAVRALRLCRRRARRANPFRSGRRCRLARKKYSSSTRTSRYPRRSPLRPRRRRISMCSLSSPMFRSCRPRCLLRRQPMLKCSRSTQSRRWLLRQSCRRRTCRLREWRRRLCRLRRWRRLQALRRPRRLRPPRLCRVRWRPHRFRLSRRARMWRRPRHQLGLPRLRLLRPLHQAPLLCRLARHPHPRISPQR